MTPKIYLFINSGKGTDWVLSLAIAEDGTCVEQHVSSSDGWAHLDIGHGTDSKHEKYRAHYPDGYEVEWVDDPPRHPGLMAAYAKNQAARAAPPSTPPTPEREP